MNISLARLVIEKVYAQGVREFCLCSGARNSPLVCVLEQTLGVKIYNYFEERSAAFFALGRIQTTDSPVAVVTTSGTAAAELLPAAVEATYSGLPLVLITADRPQAYRGSGAPQAIEQVGIFSHYVEECIDILQLKSDFSLDKWSQQKPIHLNVCFSEPLLDEPIGTFDVISVEMQRIEKILIEMRDRQSEYLRLLLHEDPVPLDSQTKVFISFCKQARKPLVIVGPLHPRRVPLIEDILQKWECPVYAEALSGLRSSEKLKNLLLKSGDGMVEQLFSQSKCDSVIRIGGVPTLRFWQDLEAKFADLPLLSVSDVGFSGLSRKSALIASLAVFKSEKALQSCQFEKPSGIIYEVDDQLQTAKEKLLQKHPQSEPSLFYALSKKIKGEASLYLGNSLPIREWDLAARYEHGPKRITGNRGANGIDGQLSSFLGWSHTNSENWAIVGDLTALYDLAALWISPQLEKAKRRIVVVNNSGGRIFDRMFNKDIFINAHQLSFQSWAHMWKWHYQEWTSIPDIFSSEDHQIIEMKPDLAQTQQFWLEFEKLWQKT